MKKKLWDCVFSRIILLLLAIAIGPGAACERDLELELPEQDPELVIISRFVAGQNIVVEVQRTRPITDLLPADYPADALVYIESGDTLLQLDYLAGSTQRPPHYTHPDLIARANVPYALKVEVPGFSVVTARTIIPAPTSLTDFSVSDLSQELSSEESSIISATALVELRDPAGVENFYHLQFFQEFFRFTVTGSDTIITSRFYRGFTFPGVGDRNDFQAFFRGGVLFKDDAFDGHSHSLSFPIKISYDPSHERFGALFAELRTTSRAYYEYQKSIDRQQDASTNGLGDGTVIIQGNIEGGIGVFGGYSSSVDSLMVL